MFITTRGSTIQIEFKTKTENSKASKFKGLEISLIINKHKNIRLSILKSFSQTLFIYNLPPGPNRAA